MSQHVARLTKSVKLIQETLPAYSPLDAAAVERYIFLMP
jgi:hypothetical protein